MADNEQMHTESVQGKLDLLLEGFQDIRSRLAVQSVQLFGSQEDGFTAGHLPMLKKEVYGLDERVATIERKHAKEAGASGIFIPFLKWISSAALVTGGALLQWFMTRPR